MKKLYAIYRKPYGYSISNEENNILQDERVAESLNIPYNVYKNILRKHNVTEKDEKCFLV